MKISGYQVCSLCDYPGKVAAVIFTQGCNFNCPFCHNKELISLSAGSLDFNQILNDILNNKIIDSVVITGGEPTIQSDLKDIIVECKNNNLFVKLDTNGYAPLVVEKLLNDNLIDYIAMDIKAPFHKYNLLAGISSNVNNIKKSIAIISSSGIEHHFRTTFFQELLTTEDLRTIRKIVPEQSKYVIQNYKPVITK